MGAQLPLVRPLPPAVGSRTEQAAEALRERLRDFMTRRASVRVVAGGVARVGRISRVRPHAIDFVRSSAPAVLRFMLSEIESAEEVTEEVPRVEDVVARALVTGAPGRFHTTGRAEPLAGHVSAIVRGRGPTAVRVVAEAGRVIMLPLSAFTAVELDEGAVELVRREVGELASRLSRMRVETFDGRRVEGVLGSMQLYKFSVATVGGVVFLAYGHVLRVEEIGGAL